MLLCPRAAAVAGGRTGKRGLWGHASLVLPPSHLPQGCQQLSISSPRHRLSPALPGRRRSARGVSRTPPPASLPRGMASCSERRQRGVCSVTLASPGATAGVGRAVGPRQLPGEVARGWNRPLPACPSRAMGADADSKGVKVQPLFLHSRCTKGLQKRDGGSRGGAAAAPVACCFGAGCAASLTAPDGAASPCSEQEPALLLCPGQAEPLPPALVFVFIVFSCDSCRKGRQKASPLPALLLLLISAASQASRGTRHFLCVAGGTEIFSMATRPAAGGMRPARMLCQRGTGGGQGGLRWEPLGLRRKGRGCSSSWLGQLAASSAGMQIGVGRIALV